MTVRASMRAFLAGVGLLGVAAFDANAQELPSGLGTVSGLAVDSLRGGVLQDAFVVVEGGGRGSATGRDGLFRIDSIPAGRYRVALLHPLLDTLALVIRTADITVAPGDTARWTLAIPSARTIVAAKCGDAADTSAALFGMVSDADSDAPVEGASVTLAWLHIDIGGEFKIRTTREERAATTLSDGTFKLCGLPLELAGEMRARRGRDSTGVIPVVLSNVPLRIQSFVLWTAGGRDAAAAANGAEASRPGAPSARGRAVVRGRVVAAKNAEPIAGARIAVTGAGAGATTDEKGEFVLAGLPAGSQAVVVRRLGFQMTEVPVNLTSRSPREITIVLDEFVPVLEEVIVRAVRDRGLERLGFTQRARVGAGYFLGPDELAKRDVAYVSDWLTQAPMLRTTVGRRGTRILTGRPRGLSGGCVNVFVDGFRWEGQPDDFLNPSEVGAIEVHSSAFTPAEFQRSFSSCETIVIWTKHKLRVQ